MENTPEFLQNESAQPRLEGGNLEELYALVLRYKELAEDIADREEELKVLKKSFNAVSQSGIPEFLGRFGLSEIKLSSGEKLMIKDDVSVTVKDQEAFYEYLKDTDQFDIVKDKVTILNAPPELREMLVDQEVDFEASRSVHSGTLKKLFRLQMEAGTKPPECVTVFPYSFTKIK